MKKRRLVRGRDWHAWAWRCKKCEENRVDVGMSGDFYGETLNDEDYRYFIGKCKKCGHFSGRWVRVKFVEVPNRRPKAKVRNAK